MEKKIIHTVFENTVKQVPRHVAIEEGDTHVSYDALNRAANRLAHALRGQGVGRNTVVGLFLPAGIQYVLSMLGVAKAGGIFMPLDVASPEKRLEKILLKSRPAIVISNGDHMANLTRRVADYGLTDRIRCLSIVAAEDPMYPDTNPDLCSGPDDGNYIMFTSGSTGAPKGILGNQKGLSHFVHWEIQEFDLSANIRASQLAPTTFDVSLRDILVPLIAGGTLCIPSTTERTDPRRQLKWMQDKRLTLAHCVPTTFRMLTREIELLDAPGEALPALKHILLAGEPLYSNDILKWRSLVGDRIELVNLYGPSETTLAKVFNRIEEIPPEPGRIIPIGKPISNTAVLILKNNALCNVGEIGEIYIKSPFRSKGYYNDPELTRGCFVQNPLNPEAEDILYQTGDLGRYLSDRSVEFLGRMDNQVKINGIRIELAEIEKNILQNRAVTQAVAVVHKTDDLENHLACYYVESQPMEANELRAYLRKRLPEYMIPAFFVKLDKLPLNLHGKIDRRALPKPEDLLYQNVEYEAPGNETETQLAAIWGEVLRLKRIGVNNAFIEVGGDSLKTMQIISRVYQAFQVSMRFGDIFPDATVRTLAERVRQMRHKSTVEDTQAPSAAPSPAIQAATAKELSMLDGS